MPALRPLQPPPHSSPPVTHPINVTAYPIGADLLPRQPQVWHVCATPSAQPIAMDLLPLPPPPQPPALQLEVLQQQLVQQQQSAQMFKQLQESWALL